MDIIDVSSLLPTGKKRYKKRLLTGIDTIVLHHSATTSGSPQAFADYHVDHNKWPGIGYHGVVGKEGETWKTNEPETISYHAAGTNGRSLGICMIGNFDKEVPGEAQMDAAVELCRYYMDVFPGIKNVLGHRETGSKKTCPGRNVDMVEFRRRVGLMQMMGVEGDAHNEGMA
ncbi:MAG: peptidoglycan recognition family protein [bacterium]